MRTHGPSDDDVADPFCRGPGAWELTQAQLLPVARILAAEVAPVA